MNIIVLGANGRTGREVLRQAINAGYSVTAVVRRKDSLKDISYKRLEVRVGNVCDPSSLKPILSGHDTVISTLGPRTPTKAACTIYSESAVAIVEAMQVVGAKRLLLSSTALLFPSTKFSDSIFHWIAKNNVREASVMEDHVRHSGLDWTIARVGFLTSAKTTGYRSADGAMPKGGRSISRPALAKFLVSEAEQPNHVKQIVGLCG